MENYISKTELEKLQQQKRDLQAERKRLQRELGDIMSNSGSFANKTPGFDETEMAIHRTEEQIGHIDKSLQDTKICQSENDLPADIVTVYSLVTGRNSETQESLTYYIQQIFETNAEATIITPGSPIGQALLGKKVGEQTTLPLPENPIDVEIIKIEKKFK